MTSLACSNNPDTVRLEVYSWWGTPSEHEAFEEVLRIHRRRHKNVRVVNRAEQDSSETRRLMAAGLLAGAPPATFQTNIGASLLGWTMFDMQEDADASVRVDGSARWVGGLSTLFEDSGLNDPEEGLREPLREDLIVEADDDDVPYGVPINIHRLNVVHYRPDAFDDGIFPDFDTLCPRDIEGAWNGDVAVDIDPNLKIAVGAGGDQLFTIVLFTFENVLPAILAREVEDPRQFYLDLFRGNRNPEDGPSGEVRRALECVQWLSQWFLRIPVENDAGVEVDRVLDSDMGWAQAVTKVADGEASFTVMGDWANGHLALGENPDQVESVPFPGTENLFVYTSDTFPLPIGAEDPAHVIDLLETIASTEAQLAFSAKKGSIPARRVDSGLSEKQRATAHAFETLPKVIANSGLFPAYYPQGQLGVLLRNMTAWEVVRDPANRDLRAQRLDEVLRFFTDAEPLLRLWQERQDLGVADPRP